VSTTSCTACGSDELVLFHSVDAVPVNSCLLVADEQSALDFPRGDLRLEHCRACGFILNTAFDPGQSTYSQDYEETQGFSPRFQSFIADLSRRWVERYDLQGKHVVEIGCGKGEFLVEMLRAGAGSGLGIDPGVHPERVPEDVADRAQWVQGFFPQDLPSLEADAVICRHTLEHIAHVREFMGQVRRSLGERRGTAVLFELPGTLHVLEDAWFWDTYYEHCSYFTAGSLARLFRRTGFEVLDVWPAYDEQYVIVEARPSDVPAPGQPFALEDDLDRVSAGADHFAATYDVVVDRWRRRIRGVADGGGEVVIWGSGSKGVAFLAALGQDARHVRAAVDINPFKHGRWMAGTGHRIVGPKELVDLRPELVILMNSTYLDEVERDLVELGVDTTLESV
jgi:SAM-dependent methyltransferase